MRVEEAIPGFLAKRLCAHRRGVNSRHFYQVKNASRQTKDVRAQAALIAPPPIPS